MASRYWKYERGMNCAEPVTAKEARTLGRDGFGGTIVVEADDEAAAYRMASKWDGLDEHDDVGSLGLDWRQLEGAAVLVEH